MKIPPQRIRIPEREREDLYDKFSDLFESGMFAYGKYVKEFEQKFARYIGKKYGVAMGSCTQALEVGMRAVFQGTRAIMLVPVNSYMASANSVINAGHTVKFCDVGKNLMLDMDELSKAIDDVAGVMLVHIGGNVHPHSQLIRDMCEARGILLIEDAAHAHGSTYLTTKKKAGSFGTISCFSFYPTKMMTVGGEGGMLLTDDENIAEFARRYRHHGRVNDEKDPQCYSHIQNGSNYCMDEIRAVIGLSQLKCLPDFIKHRQRIAKIYAEKFSTITQPGSNCYKFITYDDLTILNKSISLSGSVYRVPLHLHPLLFEGAGKYPNAERYCQLHNCLPIYSDMTDEEAAFVRNNIAVQQP